jgi:hypothetical protein
MAFTRGGFLGQIVTFVGAGVVRSGVGTLASPWEAGQGVQGSRTRATHTTRRPLPTPPFPRPYGYDGASDATLPNICP